MASRPLRRLALLGATFVVALLSCGREAGSPTAPGSKAGVRYARAFSIQPVFPPILTQASGGAGLIPFDHVHLVLRHADGSVALDTVVTFPPGADAVTLTLTVPLASGAPAAGEPLALTMDYVNAAGATVFHGGPVTVTAAPPVAGQPPPPPVTIPITYTGPGASAVSVRIIPKTLTVFTGDAFSFTAQGLDASNTVVPLTPIFFTVNDGPATVNANGSGTARSTRGTAHIVAQLLNGATDVATLTVQARPSTIAAQSGDGQSGTVGTQLPLPVVVKVAASDGVGVAGVPITFAVTRGGGSLGSATVTTDTGGFAQTTWRLGPAADTNIVTATAAGLSGSPVTFRAISRVPVPVRLAFSVQPQASIVAGATIGPVTVTALDAQGVVATSFTGTVNIDDQASTSSAPLYGTPSVTAVAGVATFSDLRINTPGTGYVLTARTIGLASANSNAFTIVVGPPSRLAFGAYPVAGAMAGVTIDPISVIVTDNVGNMVTSFTGPVTLSIAAGPVGATIRGPATVNAVAGVATFSAVQLAPPGTYQLGASAAGLMPATGPSFTVTSAGIRYTWVGASSSSWTDPTNWSPAGVPGPADSAWVPYTYPNPHPVISTPVSIGSIATGGTFNCGNVALTSTLTVYANFIDSSYFCGLSAASERRTGATLDGGARARGAPAPRSNSVGTYPASNATVILAGSGTLMGTISANLLITGGTHTLIYYTNAYGDVAVSSGAQLVFNGHQLYVSGAFATATGGTITMSNSADVLSVIGAATFGGGSESGRLTNGFIDLNGDFVQGGGAPDAFAASGSLATNFYGYVPQQNVTFANPGSSFFQNVGNGTPIFLQSDVTVHGALGGTAEIMTTSGGATRTLTASGLNYAGLSPVTVQNVAIRLVPGTSNTSFNNVNFIGFASTFTGSAFEVSLSGGPYTFSTLNFSSAGFTSSATSHFVLNSGSANFSIATSNPSVGVNGTDYKNTSTGVATWP